MTKQEEIREGIQEIIARKLFVGEVTQHMGTTLSLDNMAKEIVKYLHSQGVVVKAVGELPKNRQVAGQYVAHPHFEPTHGAIDEAQQDMLKAGYVAVEPLIQNKKGIYAIKQSQKQRADEGSEKVRLRAL